MEYPKAESLENESDVEQKLVYPLLSRPAPFGLGYADSNIKTKSDIRKFAIEKRSKRKLFYPDYVIMISGLPMVVIEAKPPSDPLDEAHREARLYCNEINSTFPSGINPAEFVISSNGTELWLGKWDEEIPFMQLSIDQFDSADLAFNQFVSQVGSVRLSMRAAKLLDRFKPDRYFKPLRMIGGSSIQNEEIAPNDFGSSLSFDFGHIFNPETKMQRSFIVRNAYIPSKRRDRYVESIDKAIRAVRHRSEEVAATLEDSGNPTELIDALRLEENMSHNLMLFIGSVGSGKSTFIDYLREVALPADLQDTIIWAHINMNYAPISGDKIYDWIYDRVSEELKKYHNHIDFDSYSTLRRLFGVEVRKFEKSIGEILDKETLEYKSRLADEIDSLRNDRKKLAEALVRYLAAERGKKLIVVLDNCDRRIRDEQLLMFEVSQWLKSELKCLVMLPIREETFDNHRTEPPLDTAIKNLAFRIEPPSFQSVLEKRIDLAISQIDSVNITRPSFTLENNVRVIYNPENLKFYLKSIKKAIYDQDNFVRRILVGVSGRDLRRAMELFLEFCKSGHISEDDIFKIIQSEGEYKLPFDKVVHTILRQNDKFYHGEKSYIKNMFAINTEDDLPSHKLRLSIMGWLDARYKIVGPLNVEGYHRTGDIVSDMQPLGFSKEVVMREILFLVESRCIITESLATDSVTEDDLVKLAPAGSVHLDLVSNEYYLSAVAEDTWISSKKHAGRIASGISRREYHLSTMSAFDIAGTFVDYLLSQDESDLFGESRVLETNNKEKYYKLGYISEEFFSRKVEFSRVNPWIDFEDHYNVGDVIERTIRTVHEVHGVFVEIVSGIDGLIHKDRINKSLSEYYRGDKIKVKIENIDSKRHRVRLSEA